MKGNIYESEEMKKELKIHWFGVDGALVMLFILLSILYGYSLLNGIDIVIGVIAPGIAIFMTIAVFIKYITEVFSFATGKKKTDETEI